MTQNISAKQEPTKLDQITHKIYTTWNDGTSGKVKIVLCAFLSSLLILPVILFPLITFKIGVLSKKQTTHKTVNLNQPAINNQVSQLSLQVKKAEAALHEIQEQNHQLMSELGATSLENAHLQEQKAQAHQKLLALEKELKSMHDSLNRNLIQNHQLRSQLKARAHENARLQEQKALAHQRLLALENKSDCIPLINKINELNARLKALNNRLQIVDPTLTDTSESSDEHTAPKPLSPDEHTAPKPLSPDEHTAPKPLSPDEHTAPKPLSQDLDERRFEYKKKTDAATKRARAMAANAMASLQASKTPFHEFKECTNTHGVTFAPSRANPQKRCLVIKSGAETTLVPIKAVANLDDFSRKHETICYQPQGEEPSLLVKEQDGTYSWCKTKK